MMHNGYRDIIDKIEEKPQWWDEYAVPRYCEPSPDETANIYADEAVLTEIQCQGCGAHFKVMFSSSRLDRILGTARSLREALEEEKGFLHYGDPPNYCCAAGATMNSIPLRVIYFWEKGEKALEWNRVKELEREMETDW